jgi:osmotically-inducible protein OsmY
MLKSRISIKDSVQNALKAHSAIPEQTIAVAVKEGTCILSGNVPSLSTWQLASDVAGSRPGVRTVRNLLFVDPKQAHRDEEVAESAQEVLDKQENEGLKNVIVKCVGGRIILTGTVESTILRLLAGKLLTDLKGIKDISNRIRVKD